MISDESQWFALLCLSCLAHFNLSRFRQEQIYGRNYYASLADSSVTRILKRDLPLADSPKRLCRAAELR